MRPDAFASTIVAAISALLLCGAASGAPDAPVRCEDVPSIGVATMGADGAITMRLRSLDPDRIAEGTLVYKPGDRDYSDVLKHLGALTPGQSTSVKPWC